jgi:imidazolonepropionase-like amidohydrolase
MAGDRPGPRYALIAQRVWDGTSDAPCDRSAVVIDGDRIEALVPAEAVDPGLQRLDLGDCTLMPALIDAHVHYSPAMGPAFLAAGVTTVRDVGNDLEWILAQRALNAAEPTRGPTIVCCGYLHEGPEAFWQHMARPNADAEALRASIRHHVERGADQIKLYDSLSLDLLQAGIDEAHRLGKFVLAHVGLPTAEEAARAGLDEIQHLSRCDIAWKPATQQERDALIDVLVECHVVVTPTLALWDRLGRILDRSLHNDRRREWVHPTHLDMWNGYLTRFGPPEERLSYQDPVPHQKRFLLRAHERGVVIGLGSDTPFPHLVPGFSLHDELTMYVDAGIRPVDALRSATSLNARVLGIESRVGRLAAGLTADMMAVRGNPLSSIDDVSRIAHVIRTGCILDRQELLHALQATFAEQPDDAITGDLLDYAHHRLKTQ